MVTGLSGGAGKTINSLGLARAWAAKGMAVAPFKKGPDYIDAVWLGLAAGRPAANLDPYFMESGTIRALFAHRMRGCDVAVIEGNRGLYDGMDVHGSCSTAELAPRVERACAALHGLHQDDAYRRRRAPGRGRVRGTA